MKKLFLAFVATLLAGTASAEVPLFAARCPSGITADSNTKGQVYVNGKVAKLIKRPNGQITAQSAGVYVDITPRGSQPPRVTATARDKTFGECEVLSFKAPDTGGAPTHASGGWRAKSSERAAQGKFDASGPVDCKMSAGEPWQQCQAGVARDGGGTATIVVTRRDGRTRTIYFEKGKATGADLSQADGNMDFRATMSKERIYKIQAGDELYEIVDSFVFGG
jgi:hypothetical protein